MLPSGNNIRHHGLCFHRYTDDVQLYISTRSVTADAPSTLTDCFITSSIDYCNSIFRGTPSKLLNKQSRTLLLTCSPSPTPVTTSPRPPEAPLAHSVTKPSTTRTRPHLTDLLHHHTLSCRPRSTSSVHHTGPSSGPGATEPSQ